MYCIIGYCRVGYTFANQIHGITHHINKRIEMMKAETNIDNVSLADIVSTLKKKVQEVEHRLAVAENLLFESKDVLTVEEAAKFLGLSKSFVYKMTHEGTLPFYKPNGKVCYFEKSVLLEWMRSTKVASQKQIEEAAQQKLQELAMT